MGGEQIVIVLFCRLFFGFLKALDFLFFLMISFFLDVYFFILFCIYKVPFSQSWGF